MKDIVYTRKYTDKNGVERKEYLTVGYIFEKDRKQIILMKSYINLNALTNEKGDVWLGVYEHKAKTQDNAPKSLYKGAETVKAVQSAVNHTQETKEEISGDLPF